MYGISIKKGEQAVECMRCGRKTPEKQVFCDACLEEMARHPVKPGSVAYIPPRTAEAPGKKSASRRKPLTAEEQLARQGRLIKLLVGLCLLLSVLLLLISYLYVQSSEFQKAAEAIGENYHTLIPNGG